MRKERFGQQKTNTGFLSQEEFAARLRSVNLEQINSVITGGRSQPPRNRLASEEGANNNNDD